MLEVYNGVLNQEARDAWSHCLQRIVLNNRSQRPSLSVTKQSLIFTDVGYCPQTDRLGRDFLAG